MNRWLHAHRFLSLNGWRVSSVCFCVIVCLRWNRVLPSRWLLITYSGGNWGGEKNEEGKKRKEKTTQSSSTIPTQLYGIVYYIYLPFNVTFNIQQLPSVERYPWWATGGHHSFDHYMGYIITSPSLTVYIWCLYMIRWPNCSYLSSPLWTKKTKQTETSKRPYRKSICLFQFSCVLISTGQMYMNDYTSFIAYGEVNWRRGHCIIASGTNENNKYTLQFIQRAEGNDGL